MTDLHPDCEPIAFLLGTWRGEGEGGYPTVEPFTYTEEMRFWHVGKPFLGYEQRTRGADGAALHSESGFWRPVGSGTIELVLAHPNGVVEVAEGSLNGTTIEVVSTAVARSPTASEVTQLERSIEVRGDELRYELRMAAVGEPITHHLTASLRRVAD